MIEEEVAKKKMCPFSANKNGPGFHKWFRCIGSECLAWKSRPHGRGYCKLIEKGRGREDHKK